MRIDAITVALRPRSPWESADLGAALVRRHAKRIFAAWSLTIVPVFVVLNALCAAYGEAWFAGLLLWWLKPVFDRVPLYVTSRAVFGEVPGLRETLVAQLRWGMKPMLAWLTWRRLHPNRALLLPVDLLERPAGRARRERVGVLSRGHGSNGVMFTVVCLNIEIVLFFALIAALLMFVPIEFLPSVGESFWQAFVEYPNVWSEIAMNALALVATSLIEPFYAAAGFGLYLNRRTHLEAWDVELSFRRLAARLSQAAVLVLACLSVAMPDVALAQDAAKPAAPPPPPTVEELFGDDYRRDGEAFHRAVAQANRDPELRPTRKESVWKSRYPQKRAERDAAPGVFGTIGMIVAFLFEYALWILAALLAVLVYRYRRTWLGWIGDAVPARAAAATTTHALVMPEVLPDDPRDAVLARWDAGDARGAFALLYRAAVARLVQRTGGSLPPGATEADTMRHSRKLGDDPAAKLFARIVARWREVAYAHRTPTREQLDALLGDWPAWDAQRGGAP